MHNLTLMHFKKERENYSINGKQIDFLKVVQIIGDPGPGPQGTGHGAGPAPHPGTLGHQVGSFQLG